MVGADSRALGKRTFVPSGIHSFTGSCGSCCGRRALGTPDPVLVPAKLVGSPGCPSPPPRVLPPRGSGPGASSFPVHPPHTHSHLPIGPGWASRGRRSSAGPFPAPPLPAAAGSSGSPRVSPGAGPAARHAPGLSPGPAPPPPPPPPAAPRALPPAAPPLPHSCPAGRPAPLPARPAPPPARSR